MKLRRRDAARNSMLRFIVKSSLAGPVRPFVPMMPDLLRSSQARKRLTMQRPRPACAARLPQRPHSEHIVDRGQQISSTAYRRNGRMRAQGDAHGRTATDDARCARRRQRRRDARVIDLGVLNERLGYFVRRAAGLDLPGLHPPPRGIDLSPAQFSVLVVIGANPGLSQAELAATLGIERARLVRLLHRLEQRGLTRAPAPPPPTAAATRCELDPRAGETAADARQDGCAEQHEDAPRGEARRRGSIATLLEIAALDLR